MEKPMINDASGSVFTTRELYDIRDRNYDWESFKYNLPRKYTHTSSNNVRSGSMFNVKSSYLDDLQRAKKAIPGPCHYKPDANIIRPISGKMDKSQRRTVCEEAKLKSQKQNHPGPGAYFKRPASAAPTRPSNSLKVKDVNKSHYLNQVQFMAADTPGVGNYNLTHPKHISGPKIFKKAYQNKKSKKEKNENKGQMIYNTVKCVSGTFDWMSSQIKKKNSNFFGRTKRFVTQSKFQKKPGPGLYKIDNNWESKTNITQVLAPSFSTKNVYYH